MHGGAVITRYSDPCPHPPGVLSCLVRLTARQLPCAHSMGDNVPPEKPVTSSLIDEILESTRLDASSERL